MRCNEKEFHHIVKMHQTSSVCYEEFIRQVGMFLPANNHMSFYVALENKNNLSCHCIISFCPTNTPFMFLRFHCMFRQLHTVCFFRSNSGGNSIEWKDWRASTCAAYYFHHDSIDVKTKHETQNALGFSNGKSKIEPNNLGLRLNSLLWSFWCTCTGGWGSGWQPFSVSVRPVARSDLIGRSGATGPWQDLPYPPAWGVL